MKSRKGNKVIWIVVIAAATLVITFAAGVPIKNLILSSGKAGKGCGPFAGVFANLFEGGVSTC